MIAIILALLAGIFVGYRIGKEAGDGFFAKLKNYFNLSRPVGS